MMRSRLIYPITVLLIGIIALSCSKKSTNNEDNDDIPDTFSELEVDPGFEYSTFQTVNVVLTATLNEQMPLQGIGFTVYKGDPQTQGEACFTGATDIEGGISVDLEIPTYLSDLYVETRYGTNRVAIQNGQLIYREVVQQ